MDVVDIFVAALSTFFVVSVIGVGYVGYRVFDPTWKPNRVEAERRAREKQNADDALMESGV